MDLVAKEERKLLIEQQEVSKKVNGTAAAGQTPQKSPLKPVASNLAACRRYLWIRCALIEKKLVNIIEFLAEEPSKYYQPEALMSSYLCAQILSSLLIGPSALEFSKSKISDQYQFEDPSADELLRRHKLANPIACLCNQQQHHHHHQHHHHNHHQQQQQLTALNANANPNSSDAKLSSKKQLARSVTEGSAAAATVERGLNSRAMTANGDSPIRVASPTSYPEVGSAERRRKPLALKTSNKRGTLVTDCHHYDCQEITEHKQTKGYSFLCNHSANNALGQQQQQHQHQHQQQASINTSSISNNNDCCWSSWSPRMLHETLHQNPKSCLLYAKNNVLLETQPREFMAGYLSLHQTQPDLILKWIPNQMINGGQMLNCSDPKCQQADSASLSINHEYEQSNEAANLDHQQANSTINEQAASNAIESSYLDFVVSLPLSQVVLLHCQFNSASSTINSDGNNNNNNNNFESLDENRAPLEGPISGSEVSVSAVESQQTTSCNNEDTLILVEADGVQRAPFKFPKGGLGLFLSCLENGLRPSRFLESAIKFDENKPDPVVQFGFDSPQYSNSENGTTNSTGSKLDVLLRRLPSLKRKTQAARSSFTTSSETTSSSIEQSAAGSSVSAGSQSEQIRAFSPTDLTKDTISEHKAAILKSPRCLPTNNYVYRIVSCQQPDWPLQTPPHSALSVGSSSTSSQSFQQAPTSGVTNFRWSLSKLARLSSKYSNRGGSSSSTASNSTAFGVVGSSIVNSTSSLCDNNSSLDNSTLISLSNDDQKSLDAFNNNNQSKLNDLVRIEAKLDDLKKSTSNDLLALRTQSLQTLCDSMRKQILARAFYGWLAHCRKVKIIRKHLIKLIKIETILLDSNETNESEELEEEYEVGLTFDNWQELIRNDNKLSEEALSKKINKLVYFGGIENDELRKIVWPYLLEHYKFKDTQQMKKIRDEVVRETYESCARDWIKVERVVKQRDSEILAANMAKAKERLKADKEPELELASQQTPIPGEEESGGKQPEVVSDSMLDSSQCEEEAEVEAEAEAGGEPEEALRRPKENDKLEKDDEKVTRSSSGNRRKKISKRRRYRLESTGSVGSDASITDQFGNNIHRIDKDVQRCDRSFWYFKDLKNLDKLRNIMCSYVWLHLDVGYVQGMCDLAAPFLVVFDDELMAYSCFSQLMKRMVSNFPHGSKMDEHFESLKYLLQVLDPKLFEIFQNNGDYTHFYFCYRWLLLDFKRELLYDDVYKVWETIWSARCLVSEHFVIFMALAMVRYYRDIIIENNMDFTDTIKFFNEMAERHDTKKIITLARECVNELRNLIKA